MIRHWSHARQKGWGYPPKKTACQSGLRFQRYKPLKSVTTAGRPAGGPLILRFLVYISRSSPRASRSLVKIKNVINCLVWIAQFWKRGIWAQRAWLVGAGAAAGAEMRQRCTPHRGGELGVLRVRKHPLSMQVHPLTTKSTPSKWRKT